MKDYRTLSKIALPLAVLFASFSSIFIRLSSAPSLIIAFYRMGFAFIMVLPYTAVIWSRPSTAVPLSDSQSDSQSGGDPSGDQKQESARDVLLSLLSGLFLALHFATWISSLSFTSVTSSVILVNTHPIMVFIISSLILREHHSPGELIFVLITVTGSTVLSWGDGAKGAGVILGDLLAVAGALSVAVYLVLGRMVRQRMKLSLYTFLVYGSSSCFLLILVLAARIPLWPYAFRDFILFFALAFFCTILGHSIYNWALKYVSSTYLSMNILIEPIAAGVMAFFLFQEIPTLLNGAGAVIVLLGIFGYSRASARLSDET